MNSVKKRGTGRPNRGGGKNAQGTGGGAGRGQQRHRGGARGGGGDGGGGGGGIGGRKGGGATGGLDNSEQVLNVKIDAKDEAETESQGKYKVEMQKLHMSVENQELIKAALVDIRGDLDLKKATSYWDSGRRLDHGYWLKDNQLVVRGGIDYSQAQPGAGDRENGGGDPGQEMSFGLQKLLGVGFHKSRCVSALSSTDGDVGAALELLMAESFNLSFDDDEDTGPGEIVCSNMDENLDNEHLEMDLEEQKQDEKMALESIYETLFTEKIPGKVWELRLTLKHLLKYLPKDNNISKKNSDKAEDKNVCPYFLAGYCRFGRRCYKKHVKAETAQKVDDDHLTGMKDEQVFIIELRFKAGSKYPHDPVIVTFTTPMSKFPRSACMKITARLMEESTNCAKDGTPAAFSIVSILEDVAEMDRTLNTSAEHRLCLPVPEGNVTMGQEERSSSNGDALFSALQKPLVTEERTKAKQKQMLLINRKMKSSYMKKLISGEVGQFDKVRKELPAWKEKDNIISLLANAQVIVVSGMTGCGKSTQVPQFILDDWLSDNNKSEHCSIICTQPRRISAVGVAARVAQERGEKVGGVVGHQIRLETCQSDRTRLLFCTTGILLRRLESDPGLCDVTHVIVDEVHERSEESDFLLMILRDTLKTRPDLRIVLMSATLNADLFSSYFRGTPVLDIPGRTFPVEQLFLEDILEIVPYSLEEHSPFAKKQEKNAGGHGGLSKDIFKGNCRDAYIDSTDAEFLLSGEGGKPAKDKVWDEHCDTKQLQMRYSDCSDTTARTLALMDWSKINYDLIESVLCYIAEGGSMDMRLPMHGTILVFLPGMQEIMTLYEQLSSHPRLGNKSGKFVLVPLHSSLSSEEQQLVFSKPGQGKRKIVISTNLAETSITIDDCVFVIDVGRMKEKRFDPTKNMESLDTVWVSQANALQRKGRAGRVMEGVCFHLYTHFRFHNHMRKDPVPEIQRVPLEKMILRIKILSAFKRKNVIKVLNNILEPPSESSVESSLQRLKNVGALYPDNSLTPLGYHLAQLPVDVRIGKLMLLGCMFRCLDAALTIAACLSFKSPFLSPFKEREAANEARTRFAAGNSDQLTAWRAYRAWAEAASRGQQAGWVFSQENYLGQKSLQTISQMKHQFAELLASIGFVPQNVTSRVLDSAARGRGGADAVASVTGPEINTNNDNNRVVSSVLCAALYPNIIKVYTPEAKYKQTAAGAMFKPPGPEDLKFKTSEDGYIHIHPSSVTATVGYFKSPYLVFHEKIKTSRVFVREVRVFSVERVKP